MAFSKAEILNSLKVDLHMALGECAFYPWPYSAYLRWRVKVGYKYKLNEVEKMSKRKGW